MTSSCVHAYVAQYCVHHALPPISCFCLVVERTHECHASLDPVFLKFVRRNLHHQNEVSRVTSCRQGTWNALRILVNSCEFLTIVLLSSRAEHYIDKYKCRLCEQLESCSASLQSPVYAFNQSMRNCFGPRRIFLAFCLTFD